MGACGENASGFDLAPASERRSDTVPMPTSTVKKLLTPTLHGKGPRRSRRAGMWLIGAADRDRPQYSPISRDGTRQTDRPREFLVRHLLACPPYLFRRRRHLNLVA